MPIYKDLMRLILSTSNIHGPMHKAHLVSLIPVLMAFLVYSVLSFCLVVELNPP